MTAIDLAAVCARAAHEVNSVYSAAIGDKVFAWDEMTDAMRAGVINGAHMALDGKTPAELHDAWSASRVAEGWTYGAVKDLDAKTHPCLVPYDELPEAQRRKDALFQSVVRAVAEALG